MMLDNPRREGPRVRETRASPPEEGGAFKGRRRDEQLFGKEVYRKVCQKWCRPVLF